MLRKELWNDLVICIPKINTSRSQDMQIGLHVKTVLVDINKQLGILN